MCVFQEHVINECQNMDKPAEMIWLVTRDPGYNKLFAVSLHCFRNFVDFCLKSVMSFFSQSSQFYSNFILSYGPNFLTFRQSTYPLHFRVKIHVSFLVPEGIFTYTLAL
jgi:hypothetical protein